jgi:hypothetical protein
LATPHKGWVAPKEKDVEDTQTIKDFHADGKGRVNIKFQCTCGEWIDEIIDLPEPSIDKEAYDERVGRDNEPIQCSHCKKEYNIFVLVDLSGAGEVHIDSAIDKDQLTVK